MKIDFISLITALIFASGIWLLLSREWLKTIMGVSLVGHAVNVLILKAGAEGEDLVPQALILTAIVIGLGLQTLLLLFAYLTRKRLRVEDTDRLEEAP